MGNSINQNARFVLGSDESGVLCILPQPQIWASSLMDIFEKQYRERGNGIQDWQRRILHH